MNKKATYEALEKRVEELERFKIAVYHSDHRMVFDVGRFEVEEITGPKKAVPKETKEILMKKAISYLQQLEKKRIAKVKFDRRI